MEDFSKILKIKQVVEKEVVHQIMKKMCNIYLNTFQNFQIIVLFLMKNKRSPSSPGEDFVIYLYIWPLQFNAL